jgi:transcriptional regulator with XRE-family HTH domain
MKSKLSPDKLKQKRSRLGYTQVELAEQLGVTGNTVARWERGEVPMPRLLDKALECVKAKGEK